MHNQVLVYRGNEVESSHRFSYAISDQNGNLTPDSTNIENLIFPRSAIKLFQVLPFITTGAYQKTKSTPEQIAIACGSHNAELSHVTCVNTWLQNNSLSPKHLVCGAGLPRLSEDVKTIYENHIELDPSYNNCSGKHTAMLLTAKHMGWDTVTYHHHDHPLQKLLLDTIEKLCGHKLDTKRCGIDGCALPNYMMSLKDLAVSAAKFSKHANTNASDLDKACKLVLDSVAAHPHMIAGKDRLCTDLAKITNGRIIAKVGAEGVYIAIIKDKNIGLALKVEDGSFRAVEVALAHLLKSKSFLTEEEVKKLSHWLQIPILNTLQNQVGKVSAII
ncbi:MAG: asparaginase [Bdellovibrionales bacterium]|nr:asparaginase [Bdellovibrionales bacterium]